MRPGHFGCHRKRLDRIQGKLLGRVQQVHSAGRMPVEHVIVWGDRARDLSRSVARSQARIARKHYVEGKLLHKKNPLTEQESIRPLIHELKADRNRKCGPSYLPRPFARENSFTKDPVECALLSLHCVLQSYSYGLNRHFRRRTPS